MWVLETAFMRNEINEKQADETCQAFHLGLTPPAVQRSAPVKLPADHLIFFDGVCGFCTRSVQTLFRLDRREQLHFAPLQSDLGRQICLANGLDPEQFDTFIYARPDQPILMRSDAALGIAVTLGFPWSLLAVFRLVPRPLRDAVYDFIARNRLRILGRREACYLPTPAERARFHD